MAYDATAALLRGRLKHSWLENAILNKSPADVLLLRATGRWAALDDAFRHRTDETIALAARLSEMGVADALEINPHLRLLPPHVREKLADELTHALGPCPTRLADAARALHEALSGVQTLWADGADDVLADAWRRTLGAAACLWDEFDRLPARAHTP